ncbi:hypothetical protein C8F04DRAFT_1269673 [Mycena alexandri]|uniref:CxC2-like cysteine cluster KDZ transposase-associated domain-containing protein n=1 Tax=Mycena alexandri TaxID=1745969 RepID=A0AAD6SC07_9AGAR|nr:hypothetical protein C8F04DRAFT_1269673 [Mycena alexandri]
MTILDPSGAQVVKYRYCACDGARTPSQQVLEAGWHRAGESETWALLAHMKKLGHGGHACPSPTEEQHTMLLIDTSGIHRIPYRYCGCHLRRQMFDLGLLLHHGWYPASVLNTTTCATVGALQLFRLLNSIGNVSVNQFITVLARRTQTEVAGTTEFITRHHRLMLRARCTQDARPFRYVQPEVAEVQEEESTSRT